jgi:hypothetical protein
VVDIVISPFPEEEEEDELEDDEEESFAAFFVLHPVETETTSARIKIIALIKEMIDYKKHPCKTCSN